MGKAENDSEGDLQILRGVSVYFLQSVCRETKKSTKRLLSSILAVADSWFLLRNQMSHEKNPGWLGYIGDYTTQLYRDYNKPL